MTLFQKIIRKTFSFWESLGLHVVPVHFYEPVPDTRLLQDAIFTTPSGLPGIDMQEESQKALVASFAEKFRKEYQALPKALWENSEFGPVDIESLYCMVRDRKPKKIIEIGSGYSTLVMLEAIKRNASEGDGCQLTTIDPYPKKFIQDLSGDSFVLVRKAVQEVSLEMFEALEKRDILFIDSSHVLKIGSDVQYEFLEILPRLAKGVAIHVHDIFFPHEYPRPWVVGQHRFFNEQYILQAFLAFNSHFAVLFAASYMHVKYPQLLTGAFGSHDPHRDIPGSFWMEKIL